MSLSYDASVNDPGTMVPYGRRLDELVLASAARILQEAELPANTKQQLRLSRDTGGCGLRSAAERCHTAYLAAALSNTTTTTPQNPALHSLNPQVTLALDSLQSIGITLDQHAMRFPTPRPTPRPAPPEAPTHVVASH